MSNNVNSLKNLGQVLLDARRLNRLWRWPGVHFMGDTRPSVAAHSFTVMQTAQMFGKIEEKECGNVIDWKQLYEKALNHDFLEAYTGDIKGPVKNYDPAVKKRIEELEEIFANEGLYNKLSDTYADEYRSIFSNGKDETLEGKILKASDITDLVIECLGEILSGNPAKEFLDAYIDGVKKLKKIGIGSVDLFLQHILQEILDSVNPNYPVDIIKLTQEIINE